MLTVNCSATTAFATGQSGRQSPTLFTKVRAGQGVREPKHWGRSRIHDACDRQCCVNHPRGLRRPLPRWGETNIKRAHERDKRYVRPRRSDDSRRGPTLTGRSSSTSSPLSPTDPPRIPSIVPRNHDAEICLCDPKRFLFLRILLQVPTRHVLRRILPATPFSPPTTPTQPPIEGPQGLVSAEEFFHKPHKEQQEALRFLGKRQRARWWFRDR